MKSVHPRGKSEIVLRTGSHVSELVLGSVSVNTMFLPLLLRIFRLAVCLLAARSLRRL